MTPSSKFGQRRGRHGTPRTCVTPRPPPEEEECPVDPEYELTNSYDIDVTWFIYHYVFSGEIQLYKRYNHAWSSHEVPPQDGVLAYFFWYPALQTFSATIYLYAGGTAVCSMAISNEPYPTNGGFDTGHFQYLSPIWAGNKDGRIYNPCAA